MPAAWAGGSTTTGRGGWPGLLTRHQRISPCSSLSAPACRQGAPSWPLALWVAAPCISEWRIHGVGAPVVSDDAYRPPAARMFCACFVLGPVLGTGDGDGLRRMCRSSTSTRASG